MSKLIWNMALVGVLLLAPAAAWAQEEPKADAQSNQQEVDETESDKAEQEDDAATRRFNEADLDSNGSISRAEMQQYITEKLPEFKHFEELMRRIDADKNNVVSKDEFENRRSIAIQLQDTPVEFVDSYNAMFESKEPVLGSIVDEELVGFDETGKAIKFKELRGKHTVITFGCLT